MQGGQVGRNRMKLWKEEGCYRDPEDLAHHAKESGFFHVDTKKAKVEQRDQFGDNSNSPNNLAERPDLPLITRYSSKNSTCPSRLRL